MISVKQALGIGFIFGPIALGSAYIIGKYNPYTAYIAKLAQIAESSQLTDYEKAQIAQKESSHKTNGGLEFKLLQNQKKDKKQSKEVPFEQTIGFDVNFMSYSHNTEYNF
jgi:uncharacterized protein YchJ